MAANAGPLKGHRRDSSTRSVVVKADSVVDQKDRTVTHRLWGGDTACYIPHHIIECALDSTGVLGVGLEAECGSALTGCALEAVGLAACLNDIASETPAIIRVVEADVHLEFIPHGGDVWRSVVEAV